MNGTSGEQKYSGLQLKLKTWDLSIHLSRTPNHLSEVYLTNELIYVHNFHRTIIEFHTHPLILGEGKFTKNLLM
jgi:hypothetical protein